MDAGETDRAEPRILLIEDEPADVALVCEAMRDLRCEAAIDVVADGYAALDYLRRQPPYEAAARPDLIVLDLNLPRLDGRQILRYMRVDVRLRDIPVVVLSTASEPSIVAECRQYADDYVVKGRVWPEFLKRFRAVLDFLGPGRRALPTAR